MRIQDITLAVVGIAASAATLALTALPESTSLFRKNLKAESVNIDFEFSKWAADHNKQYDTIEEYEHRLEQFKRNFYEIRMLNSMNSEVVFGFNQFSDWTEEEFQGMLGYEPLATTETVEFADVSSMSNGGVDWRANGKVNPVKNQGGCGSCWAFSAVASMETRHAVQKGTLYRLSEQELVDCSKNNGGCSGGHFITAWNDMKALGGVNTESSYPYTARQGTCKFNKSAVVVNPTGSTKIAAQNPSQIKAALSNGPVSIGVAAGNSAFQSYKSGVWNGSGCGTKLDHAVAVVGWGNANNQDYFIVRNSWGTGWGESGYIRLASQAGAGPCGMNLDPAQVSM